jgi:hypothetical protein
MRYNITFVRGSQVRAVVSVSINNALITSLTATQARILLKKSRTLFARKFATALAA